MESKNRNDHWAFLEEIEAPMWADLTLEANSNNQHIGFYDDEWFYRSHPFHQCSSRQLKAAFSHSGEDIMALDYDLVGPSSPKFPSSVSKSRGKDFVSKKWREDNKDFSLHKQQQDKVRSATSSCANSGSSKMKPKSGFIHLKGTSSSKSSSVCESSVTGNCINNYSKTISACGDPSCSLSSMTNKVDESSTTSTITSESGQQQQNFMEKSNQPLSHTDGLLSVRKTGLRKSGVTRPASRVEIYGDRRQSRGCKSSSSKSSVGSSLNPCYYGRTSESGQQQQQKFMEKSNQPLSQTNELLSVIKAGLRKSVVTRPVSRVEINGKKWQSRGRKSSSSKSSKGSSSNGYDGRTSICTSIQYKERTPDSRNVARMTYVVNNRIQSSKVCKTSTHKIEQGTQNYRMRPDVANSVHLEAAKPKVLYQTLRRKPLERVRVDKKKSTTATVKSKEKTVVGGSNSLAASGKENVKGGMAGSRKGNSKGIAVVTMVWSPKGTKESILQRNDRTGLAGKGKVSDQSHRVKLKDVSKRPHFR